MRSDWYSSLFEFANFLYGSEVYSYYFDIPFEETLKRHLTREKSCEFGEESMRRWWVEKDFSDRLKETVITADKDIDTIVDILYKEINLKCRCK